MASRIDALTDRYADLVSMSWDRGLAPPQRVWFAVYPKEEERRLRYKVEAFRLATEAPGKKWVLVDLTDSFARWIDAHRYRDLYFDQPAKLPTALPRFLDATAQYALDQAAAKGADEDTVVALLGVASLFGFAQVSDLVPRIVGALPGRLLVFFPGSREANSYKLLDAREGWNYLATAITPFDDGSAA